MRDIDPQLMRLRELEARIAFAEYHIHGQRELVDRLCAGGFATGLAHQLLRSMEDSLAILRLRRADMLASMEATQLHRPPGDASG
jgi:hypothetical protein